ncbi:hypothetical protein [Neptuniibacter sp. QD37_11]|uniref:hypothetical protein n=1 Tax=Neptuniibacter sp. QD37_11 TaxID=3398209 RepID=UPI0039F568E2
MGQNKWTDISFFSFPADESGSRMGCCDGYLIAITQYGKVYRSAISDDAFIEMNLASTTDELRAILLKHCKLELSANDLSSKPLKRMLNAPEELLQDPSAQASFDAEQFRPGQPVDAGMGNFGFFIGTFSTREMLPLSLMKREQSEVKVTAQEMADIINNNGLDKIELSVVEGVGLVVEHIGFKNGGSFTIVCKGDPMIESLEMDDTTYFIDRNI